MLIWMSKNYGKFPFNMKRYPGCLHSSSFGGGGIICNIGKVTPFPAKDAELTESGAGLLFANETSFKT